MCCQDTQGHAHADKAPGSGRTSVTWAAPRELGSITHGRHNTQLFTFHFSYSRSFYNAVSSPSFSIFQGTLGAPALPQYSGAFCEREDCVLRTSAPGPVHALPISSSNKEAAAGPGLSRLVPSSGGNLHLGHCWWVRAQVSSPDASQLCDLGRGPALCQVLPCASVSSSINTVMRRLV